MKLLLISHTEHYEQDGTILGWGPTVREINHLAAHFESITHIACLHTGKAPLSSLPYQSDNIRFIAIPPFGGPGLANKCSILTSAPGIILKVMKALKTADVFQLRAPTSMGVYLIPILTLFTGKKGWYKYAGNWVQKHPPLSYFIQRWWLTRMQRRKVTMNGQWADQPAHCLSFENPCLDDSELITGQTVVAGKQYAPPFELCFAGRVEAEKGMDELVKAAFSFAPAQIKKIWIVGDGPERMAFEKAARLSPIPIEFTGFLPRNAISELYQRCHFIVLPSRASEGFPKVLAEAMNYGCIPVSAAISSIPQFVRENENGYLWDASKETFDACLRRAFRQDLAGGHRRLAENGRLTACRFSYRHYIDRICTEIL